MIKVLHLSRSKLANAPIHINNFLNKYGKGLVECRNISVDKGTKEEEHDILWHWINEPKNKRIVENVPQLEELLEWSDILHIHNQPPYMSSGPCWKITSDFKKPVVYQVHSEPVGCKKMWNSINNNFTIHKTICIAQYQTVRWKGEHGTVRNIVDIDSELLQPCYGINEKPHITFAPSNKSPLAELRRKRKSEWAYKSFYEIDPILKNLENQKKITSQIFFHMPFTKCMELRKKGDIHIDDIYTGSYHLSSLEGLSQGKVVICNLKKWMIDFLKKFLNCTDLPWIIANKDNLEHIILDLIEDEEHLFNLQAKSRKWMEKYWNPDLILKDYLNVYNSL